MARAVVVTLNGICYTDGVRIALVGPTAVGKTAVGIALAQKIGAEIVSADSMQVYRRMDIGTAKPTADEQRQAVFHGLDVVDPHDEWTLADFQRLGERACEEIAGRGRLPLLVGGTGLYVRALTTPLAIPTAPPDEEFRARWRAFAGREGNAALQQELARSDPQAAARIHVNDIGRLIRALEVYAATGRTLSELHAENRAMAARQDVFLVGLNFADRNALYTRIEARVDEMLALGFLGEVRGLLESGCGPSLKPMQSLGYRQLASFLAGEQDWDAAVAEIKQETRRFAKRQLIWFRSDARLRWLAADGRTAGQLAEDVSALLEQHQKGTPKSDEQTAA